MTGLCELGGTKRKGGICCQILSRDSFSSQKIDSFHKIWFLLVLHQHSDEDRINREDVRRVTIADGPTLDEAVEELQDAGLLISNGKDTSLRDAPEVRSDLDTMAHAIEDPRGRQELFRRQFRHAAVPI